MNSDLVKLTPPAIALATALCFLSCHFVPPPSTNPVQALVEICRSLPEDGTEALVLHYGFAQDTGGRVVDLSGNHQDGIAVDTHWIEDGGVDGGALSFNGQSSMVEIPFAPRDEQRSGDDGLRPVEDPFSVSVWFKTSASHPIQQTLVSAHYPGRGAEGWWMTIDEGAEENELRWFVGAGDRNDVHIESDEVVTDGEWHHAVGVWANDTLRLYIDGVLQEDTREAAGAVVYGRKASFRVGNMPRGVADPGKYPLNGLLDELRIYRCEITPEGVRELFRSSS